MAIGLFLTFITSFFVTNTSLVIKLAQNRILFFGFILAELGLVIYISSRVKQMSLSQLTFGMVLYAVLNGITLSLIFVAYTTASIASTFFITAGMFGTMAIYGYTTDKDLTNWGSILIMALVGIIIASIINFFLHSSAIYWIINIAGVIVFTGLTAYDSQKIKEMGRRQAGSGDLDKLAMMGALKLYLDFINLFLFLWRICGNKK
mgnify:FL=1